MKKLILIASLFLFIGCSKIPLSEFEYIDIPKQLKEPEKTRSFTCSISKSF